MQINVPQRFQILREIIFSIETDPVYNYEFLNLLKKNNIKYIEDGKEWNYENNFEVLKNTLTSESYILLENKEPLNPLTLLVDLLKDIATNKSQYSNNIKYIKKYEYNFPLIEGTIGLRLHYYINYILDSNKKHMFHLLNKYISIMDTDPEINIIDINEKKFNLKLYLLILHLCDIMNGNEIETLNNYFLKGTSFSSIFIPITDKIQKLDDTNYIICNNFEQIKIKKEDYVISNLLDEINHNYLYPLKILLYRNESFQKWKKDGGFLKELGLYEAFIDYFKYFIKSKCIYDILSESDYENIQTLIHNDNYLNEIFKDDKYIKFVPFIGTKTDFGFTNKEILLSVINIIPELTKYDSDLVYKYYNEMFFIMILLSIGVKFITCLHEILIHFTSGYIHFISEKKISANSPKTKLNSKDGGYAFEEKLSGINKFSKLTLQNIIALLDGETCNNNLKIFQEELQKQTDIKEISKKKFENGFLGFFFKKFNFSIHIFENEPKINDISVKCRSQDEFFVVSLEDRECKCYAGSTQFTKNIRSFDN